MPSHRLPDGEPDPVEMGRAEQHQLLLSTTGRATMLVGLFWDVGVSLIGYYGLRLAGASEWVALMGAAVAAALRVLWVAVRDRRLSAFATGTLVVFGLGLGLAFIDGDPRFLLVKDLLITGVIGAAFLLTTAFGRPLTLGAVKSWQPDRADEVARLYESEPAARRGFRVSAIVWGMGLLVEAAVRVPLIYLLPVDVMVGLSTAMIVTAMLGLVTWNGWYIARMMKHLSGRATLSTA